MSPASRGLRLSKDTAMNTHHRMHLAASGVALAALLVGGCSSMSERQRGTATGAGVGAVAGAVVSSATGGKAGTGAVVGGALGAVIGNVWSKRQEERRVAMEQATRGTGVEVTRTADNQLRLNIPNDVSFDTNSAVIRSSMHSVLDPLASNMRGDAQTRVTIVGHTDSTGTSAVNDPLSIDRAQSVRDYLAARGVPSSSMQISGRGEREPVADNGTDSGRARNRRVEIYLREPAA
jgi:outer membrane protein OmpA-like peptidoglycan-associated protein